MRGRVRVSNEVRGRVSAVEKLVEVTITLLHNHLARSMVSGGRVRVGLWLALSWGAVVRFGFASGCSVRLGGAGRRT